MTPSERGPANPLGAFDTSSDPLRAKSPKPGPIAIVMPAYNAGLSLAAAAAAVLAQDPELQLVIVDDGSTDETLALARSLASADPRVLVLSQENGGEASALNLGFAYARAEMIGIVEADVTLEHDWLKHCLAALAAAPELIGVGGYLRASPGSSWIARLAGYEVELKLDSVQGCSEHITSANALYRAEAWAIAGPFDIELVNASLDAAFNQRLRQAGWQLALCPAARASHLYKSSLRGYLSRHFSYGLYRIESGLTLYPRDRLLALQVLGAVLGLALAFLGLLLGSSQLIVLALAPPLMHLHEAFIIARRWRDPAAALYPFVAGLRDLVAVSAASLGITLRGAAAFKAALLARPRLDRSKSPRSPTETRHQSPRGVDQQGYSTETLFEALDKPEASNPKAR